MRLADVKIAIFLSSSTKTKWLTSITQDVHSVPLNTSIINSMTEAQKKLILGKISSVGQPTNLKPYIPSIKAMMERVDVPHKETSSLIDAIFTIHANDRRYSSYEPTHVEEENIKAYKTIQRVLKDNMIPQVCEKCNEGEDTMIVDSARLCYDCINDIKHKYGNNLPF